MSSSPINFVQIQHNICNKYMLKTGTKWHMYGSQHKQQIKLLFIAGSHALTHSIKQLLSRGVVVNLDFGERFPRPRSQQRGRLRPCARRVAVLGLGAGRGPGVLPPEIFCRFLMPNPAFCGQFGSENKLIEGSTT